MSSERIIRLCYVDCGKCDSGAFTDILKGGVRDQETVVVSVPKYCSENKKRGGATAPPTGFLPGCLNITPGRA